MKYAAILAGGTGKRMSSALPKQFLELQREAIIIRTIRRILSSALFDKLVIAIHPEWKSYLEELIAKAALPAADILITEGGKERLDSIRNTTGFITSTFGPAGEKDYIVIFDAVRPFVSHTIMQDSLEALTRHEAVVAALPAVDTMLWIEEGTRVDSMPQRSKLFHGQAPDSFRLVTLCQALAALTPEEEQIITGTAQICMLKGIDIHTIPGDPKNIKVTTPFDIQLGEVLCQLENQS